MSKKYELVKDKTTYVSGATLYRIKALRNLGFVNIGDIGGYVQTEDNLSQDGECWIFDNAKVYGNAKIIENALVRDNAVIHNNAIISGSATVLQNAVIYGNAHIFGYAVVLGFVAGNARIYGNADVHGTVTDDGVVCQNMNAKFSTVTTDLTKAENILDNIRCQTNLPVFSDENGDYVLGFKHVRKTERLNIFLSNFDRSFNYKLNEWAEAFQPDTSIDSCTSGLHFSHLSYWENQGCNVVIQVKCYVKDIITIQRGKIRCSKLLPLAVVKNGK